jgi:hypothetical protein
VRTAGWVWIDTDPVSLSKLGKQVAEAVRNLAEGDAAEGEGRPSPWLIVAAVIGGLIGLSILVGLIGTLLNF